MARGSAPRAYQNSLQVSSGDGRTHPDMNRRVDLL